MSESFPGRVLVVGSGSIAQRHVRNLLALEVMEVLVLTTRDVSAVEAFSNPGVHVIPELPKDCPVAAIIANDTDRHLSSARELVDRGVHILVEKPLAVEPSADLSRLCDDIRSSGLVGRVAYNLRLLGVFALVRQSIDSGAIGQPLFARIEVGQWLPDWRPDRPVEGVYSASAERGGGVALDLSHEIDYMTMLFGYPDEWGTRSAHTGALPIQSADVFDGIYSYSSGFSCTVHMDYLERHPRRRMRIVGRDGVIECDLVAHEFRQTTAEGVRVCGDAALFDVQATYVDEARSFLAEVSGAEESGVRLPTLDEAADVLRLLSSAGSLAGGGEV